MNKLQETLLRCSLKPRLECDLPGRLRMAFPRYTKLPDAAKPYLHYVEDVLKMLPGVQSVQVNPRIGTVLVLYDKACCSARQILRWVDIVVDTGIEIAGELDLKESAEEKASKDAKEKAKEEEISALVLKRLILRLPQSGQA